MANEEFDALMAKILAEPRDTSIVYPACDYNPHGDSIEITLEPDVSYYGRWVPPGGITELRAHDDDRLVGLIVHSVKKRIQRAAEGL